MDIPGGPLPRGQCSGAAGAAAGAAGATVLLVTPGSTFTRVAPVLIGGASLVRALIADATVR